MNGGAAELVDDDVRVLMRKEHVSGAAVQLQGDLVRHRRRRQEQRALLAEQQRGSLLKLVDRGIFTHLLVADICCREGGAHPRSWARDGVGAQVDHAAHSAPPADAPRNHGYPPGMDLALLDTHITDCGEPSYRARQVWEWAARGATGYDAMTNVPAPLREDLSGNVPFSTLTVTDEQQAKDGTVKTLFRTHDGHPVEAVLMRYRDGRRSICVSSQSGCPLTCTFCATGTMQLGAQPDRVGDPRPGAPFPAPRGDRPLRLHGHG